MRLNLKRVLARLSVPQKDVAERCEVSSALIAQLVNHGIWPRNDSLRVELHQRITALLKEAGADGEMIATAFEEWPLPRSNAEGADVPTSTATPETDEDEHMLLRNETLTHEAREHFGLVRSPFIDDIATLADVFACPSTRRARAALMDAALNQGFVALVGESGSGKTTLREELEERIRLEGKPVIVIKPYVMEMESSDARGNVMKSGQIAEAIIHTLDPGATVRASTQARARQVHALLTSSQQAGYSNLLIVEEAHRMPKSTLRHLKSFMEMKHGLRRLLGVVLIGQPELDMTLSDKLADVREIVQRCERREMLPLDDDLQPYLAHKFARVGVKLADLFADDACDAIRARLVRIPRGGSRAEAHSICYPLVVNNLVVRALNAAAAVQFPRVDAQVIRGC
ncbi:ExeA family protein [Thauera sp. 2A1]|uniref:ExeA family protein n=1 Tax=Thauera sp. 2A1 TaxID=2570191 RepID=UPI0012919133|nr:AAA family ATPase [Thauera sp. 2A1]KAI5914604.1 AAA family ATPase [Thauera sp. 2A1]